MATLARLAAHLAARLAWRPPGLAAAVRAGAPARALLQAAAPLATKARGHKASSSRLLRTASGAFAHHVPGRNHNFATKSAPCRARRRASALTTGAQTRRLVRIGTR